MSIFETIKNTGKSAVRAVSTWFDDEGPSKRADYPDPWPGEDAPLEQRKAYLKGVKGFWQKDMDKAKSEIRKLKAQQKAYDNDKDQVNEARDISLRAEADISKELNSKREELKHERKGFPRFNILSREITALETELRAVRNQRPSRDLRYQKKITYPGAKNPIDVNITARRAKSALQAEIDKYQKIVENCKDEKALLDKEIDKIDDLIELDKEIKKL